VKPVHYSRRCAFVSRMRTVRQVDNRLLAVLELCVMVCISNDPNDQSWPFEFDVTHIATKSLREDDAAKNSKLFTGPLAGETGRDYCRKRVEIGAHSHSVWRICGFGTEEQLLVFQGPRVRGQG
jgi:hypothetical protein